MLNEMLSKLFLIEISCGNTFHRVFNRARLDIRNVRYVQQFLFVTHLLTFLNVLNIKIVAGQYLKMARRK